MLQLPGGGAGALRLLAALARTTPSVELRLGTDLDALPATLDHLLDDLLDRPAPDDLLDRPAPTAARRTGGRAGGRPGQPRSRQAGPAMTRSPTGPVEPMVEAPLVSVIVPMFNAAAFIGEALESIAAQDDPALEVVAVDDGSTDDTATVARSDADRLGLDLQLEHEVNQGPSIARNLALARARGSLITFLDADDRMVAGRLAVARAHLRAHPEADAVMGTHVNVVEPGVEPPEWLAKLPPVETHPHYLVMTVMARAELFDRVGGFDPAYQFAGEDTEWYLRAKSAGAHIDLVDHLMVWRRIHGSNLTYQVEDLDRALFRLLRERARRAERHEPGRPRASTRCPVTAG